MRPQKLISRFVEKNELQWAGILVNTYLFVTYNYKCN